MGVTLDGTLSWSTHTDNVVAKMSRGISIIKRCSSLLTDVILKQVFQSLVLSHLDYCPSVWSNASRQELNKNQLTQKRATRLALNCSMRDSVEGMHTKLSWLKVEDRIVA